MSKESSRYYDADMEKIRSMGNIYQTILICSHRAYALRKGATPKIDISDRDPFSSGVMTSLLEFQTGK